MATRSMLLLACFGGASCRALPPLEQRLVKLAAPQRLARSAGGSYATTDTYLSLLEIPEPSKQLVAAVSQLPKDEAIIFIAPGREPEIELAYRTIATLAWPHEIGALHCGTKDENPALLFKPRGEKKIQWLMLFRLSPASSATVQADIGPHLKLISTKEDKEWNSYCSQ